MSKQDKSKEINTSGIISGFIAKDIETNTKQVETKKEVLKDTPPSVSDDRKLTFDAESGNYNKKNNYTITFKIDEDLKDYFKIIEKITFIESAKSGKIESKTKTEFVNDLIREQYYKLIGASVKDDADTINKKWIDYKNKIIDLLKSK